ncbi:lipoyl synthase [Gorillibacterium massiliense]|uniref:lipoyl synthase n=1 Tax=Gorillibacterium massiliense TaxID=1280390 RepID=UPI0004B21065|nr:lipoyl synthase [Gorillibacterium massiliense]
MIDKKPEWLKVTYTQSEAISELKSLMETKRLHTVCEEARCPNIFECWQQRTATFMILGSICTRACRFCAVDSGRPNELDLQEPERVAESVAAMGLKHAVITSVARDDLLDGGASIFAACITAIRERTPGVSLEVLIPDFMGNDDALRVVLEAKPNVLNHNIETVKRLSDKVRAKAKYDRSLRLLTRSKEIDPAIATKSGIMLGLGESLDEVREALYDLRSSNVEIVTIGQYLQPSSSHHPVILYRTPEEFEQLKKDAYQMGFRHVESGPLVRSSYHAGEQMTGERG